MAPTRPYPHRHPTSGGLGLKQPDLKPKPHGPNPLLTPTATRPQVLLYHKQLDDPVWKLE